jgi:ABC-type antimicrobial peptide transport system permease subunit
MAYLTGQRVPEIGVRMALGASPAHVMRGVLRQSSRMIAFGAIVGIAGAMAAGRVLVHAVSGMSGLDASTMAIMTAVLAIAALAASYVPARRASRIDPVRALRQE